MVTFFSAGMLQGQASESNSTSKPLGASVQQLNARFQDSFQRTLFAVDREGVQFVVCLTESEHLITRADIHYAVGDRWSSADRAPGVELPDNFSGLCVVSANKIA